MSAQAIVRDFRASGEIRSVGVPHDAIAHDAVAHDAIPHDAVPHDGIVHGPNRAVFSQSPQSLQWQSPLVTQD